MISRMPSSSSTKRCAASIRTQVPHMEAQHSHSHAAALYNSARGAHGRRPPWARRGILRRRASADSHGPWPPRDSTNSPGFMRRARVPPLLSVSAAVPGYVYVYVDVCLSHTHAHTHTQPWGSGNVLLRQGPPSPQQALPGLARTAVGAGLSIRRTDVRAEIMTQKFAMNAAAARMCRVAADCQSEEP